MQVDPTLSIIRDISVNNNFANKKITEQEIKEAKGKISELIESCDDTRQRKIELIKFSNKITNIGLGVLISKTVLEMYLFSYIGKGLFDRSNAVLAALPIINGLGAIAIKRLSKKEQADLEGEKEEINAQLNELRVMEANLQNSQWLEKMTRYVEKNDVEEINLCDFTFYEKVSHVE